MKNNSKLAREQVGLFVVDVQEEAMPKVENACQLVQAIQKVIRGFQILELPIYATEHGRAGNIVAPIKGLLGENQTYWYKTSFSCLDDPHIKKALQDLQVQQWIIVGIEAHVCVLQTAIDLILAGKEVIVLNDAISSRSIYDFSSAIAEMRDFGVRITCTETMLFELLRHSKASEFKEISQLIK